MTNHFTCPDCLLDLPGDAFTSTADGTRRSQCRACFVQAIQTLHGRRPHGYARRQPAYLAARKRAHLEGYAAA